MDLTGLFGHDNYARRWKRWALEIRFEHPLSKRQQRTLRNSQLGDVGWVGRDGYHGDWIGVYPNIDDEQWLVEILRRVGLRAWVRAAPLMPWTFWSGEWGFDWRAWPDAVRQQGIGRKRRLPDEWFAVDPLAVKQHPRVGMGRPRFAHWEWA